MLIVGTSFPKFFISISNSLLDLGGYGNKISNIESLKLFFTFFFYVCIPNLLLHFISEPYYSFHFQVSFWILSYPSLFIFNLLKIFAIMFLLFNFHRTAFAWSLIICPLNHKSFYLMSRLCHTPSFYFS